MEPKIIHLFFTSISVAILWTPGTNLVTILPSGALWSNRWEPRFLGLRLHTVMSLGADKKTEFSSSRPLNQLMAIPLTNCITTCRQIAFRDSYYSDLLLKTRLLNMWGSYLSNNISQNITSLLWYFLRKSQKWRFDPIHSITMICILTHLVHYKTIFNAKIVQGFDFSLTKIYIMTKFSISRLFN